ncbi:XRE family transcriptional regulator [Utexia brackfieldae]|uniref:LexA family transcriptional regulator n=1 Tax=Utexia brackfieldae TaxID=3074108 RepID=UPI00370CFDCA
MKTKLNYAVLTFRDRLSTTMQGLNVSAFAKKCGMSETVIRDYLSGKTFPSLNRLATISEKCNVSYSWLATGYDIIDPPLEDEKKVYNEKIIRVPTYAKHLPDIELAKKMKLIRDTPPTMTYPVLEGWVDFRGFEPHKLISYWCKGKLLAPDIKNNDCLIVNTEYGEIIDGDIYLLEYEDITLVRKIQKTADGWLLSCNTDQHVAIQINQSNQDRLQIIGRVVLITRNIY